MQFSHLLKTRYFFFNTQRRSVRHLSSAGFFFVFVFWFLHGTEMLIVFSNPLFLGKDSAVQNEEYTETWCASVPMSVSVSVPVPASVSLSLCLCLCLCLCLRIYVCACVCVCIRVLQVTKIDLASPERLSDQTIHHHIGSSLPPLPPPLPLPLPLSSGSDKDKRVHLPLGLDLKV